MATEGLRIVGAGVGRTGTISLKAALETLLGAPCYHMLEAIRRPGDLRVWRDALAGDLPDWHRFFTGFAAAVDFPTASFWPEISAAFPEAIVLLSVRKDAPTWWDSASRTIFAIHGDGGGAPAGGDDPTMVELRDLNRELMDARFSKDTTDAATTIAAYERHNAAVRAAVPADRLVEWQPGDGWGPLCAALGVAVPDEPFPHGNTTAEFRRFMDSIPSRSRRDRAGAAVKP